MPTTTKKHHRPGMVTLRLVPVQVFTTGECCQHGHDLQDCPNAGFGFSDAVSCWSDCNRAEGQIYRIDDSEAKDREPGDTVEIFVRPQDVPFFQKRFGG